MLSWLAHRPPVSVTQVLLLLLLLLLWLLLLLLLLSLKPSPAAASPAPDCRQACSSLFTAGSHSSTAAACCEGTATCSPAAGEGHEPGAL